MLQLIKCNDKIVRIDLAADLLHVVVSRRQLFRYGCQIFRKPSHHRYCYPEAETHLVQCYLYEQDERGP